MDTWLKENEDETYTFIGKKNVEYVLKELEGDQIMSVFEIAEKSNGSINPMSLLVARSLIKPEIPDTEVGKIKGSDFLKLIMAVKEINGLGDLNFMSAEEK